jgi:hypothetical protein
MFSGGSLIFSLVGLFAVLFVVFLAWEIFWVLVIFLAETITMYLKSLLVFLFIFSKELLKKESSK